MTSMTYQAAMEVNPALRERLQRAVSETRAELPAASFLERLANFWADLYAAPMPAPRYYL